MGKTYRTAQGKTLDLEKLKLQNELVPAVGNMKVNARGDQLGVGGQVVKSREEMLDQYYQHDVAKRRKGAKEDVIPTRAGKASDIEPAKKYDPSGIEADVSPVFAETTPKVLEDDFVDPEPIAVDDNVTTEDNLVEPEPVAQPKKEKQPVTDPVEQKSSSTDKKTSGTKLKGGLARAIAKTKEYDDKKNKPKRI